MHHFDIIKLPFSHLRRDKLSRTVLKPPRACCAVSQALVVPLGCTPAALLIGLPLCLQRSGWSIGFCLRPAFTDGTSASFQHQRQELNLQTCGVATGFPLTANAATFVTTVLPVELRWLAFRFELFRRSKRFCLSAHTSKHLLPLAEEGTKTGLILRLSHRPARGFSPGF